MKNKIKNVLLVRVVSVALCVLGVSMGTAYAGVSHRAVIQDIEGMHIVSNSGAVWTDVGAGKCADVIFPAKVEGGPSANNAVHITTSAGSAGEFTACSTTYQSTVKLPTSSQTALCYVEAEMDPHTDSPILKATGPGCHATQDGTLLFLQY